MRRGYLHSSTRSGCGYLQQHKNWLWLAGVAVAVAVLAVAVLRQRAAAAALAAGCGCGFGCGHGCVCVAVALVTERLLMVDSFSREMAMGMTKVVFADMVCATCERTATVNRRRRRLMDLG